MPVSRQSVHFFLFIAAFIHFLQLPAISALSHYPSSTPLFWLEHIKHQGVAAFNPDNKYTVFRNVNDFGAKGDGIHDDTDAINAAIASGGRCAPWSCQSSTTTAAIVYFPSGTYMISSSLVDYYETQIIGNPNGLPILKASKNFTGNAMIEGNSGNGWNANNIFYRQVKNLEFDLRELSSETKIAAINWPTAQASSLSNLVVWMSEEVGTRHQGISILSGGAGFLSDIMLHGGSSALLLGSGNPTVRNITINNALTAFNIPAIWGAVLRNINIENCSIAVNISATGQEGAVTFIDSSISNTKAGFLTSYNSSSASNSVGASLILENIHFENVGVAVQDLQGVALEGTKLQFTVQAWGQGHAYKPNGPQRYQGSIGPNKRPLSLTTGSKYYEKSKPQYASIPVSQFQSARDGGAKGDGVTDDTVALQRIISKAAQHGNIVFFDAGTYKITDTLYIPPASRLVGESYSVIMAAGWRFSNMNQPRVAIQVGKPGEVGTVEWSDMIVSTQGSMAGAILIEWNLASYGTPSGMWDVHARVGGFTGSELQLEQCPPTPLVATPPAAPDRKCIAAFMTMHITRSARGLYMENIWLWTSDHDLDSANNDQVTIYSGRGLYVESLGPLWLVGISVEHHSLYQYQFFGASDIFIGFAQSETPYYQPNPNATIPFPEVKLLKDPDFSEVLNCVGNCADAWGLRVVDTSNFLYYAGGHFSYFNNNNNSCSGTTCQTQIVGLEGLLPNLSIYNLLTVGTEYMVMYDGFPVAHYNDNVGSQFPSTVSLIRCL